MKNSTLILILIILFPSLFLSKTYAQDKEKEDKLNISPIGRMLIDGALLDDKEIRVGMALPSIRLGFRASYQDFIAKVELDFAGSKVSFKDLYIQKSIDRAGRNSLRLGYFLHQFGLQSMSPFPMSISMEEPSSHSIFYNDRLLGLMWVNNSHRSHLAMSIFSESASIKKKSISFGNIGWGLMGRFVYSPIYEKDFNFHIGISKAFESPRYNEDERLNHSSFVFSKDFPSRVFSKKALLLSIDKAKFLIKYTPEILFSYKNIALESQFYHMYISREGQRAYNAYGGYAFLRYLIKGNSYKYDKNNAMLKNSKEGDLELVLGYDYSQLNDYKEKILGGRLSDISLTMNYYINKFMIARLRYSYSSVYDSPLYQMKTEKMQALQARLQVVF